MRHIRLLLTVFAVAVAGAVLPIAASAGPAHSAGGHAAVGAKHQTGRAASVLRYARIQTLGVHRVKIAVTTRSARWTTVHVRVGTHRTRELWTARGHHATLTLTLPVSRHRLMIHATDRRTKPMIAIHVSALRSPTAKKKPLVAAVHPSRVPSAAAALPAPAPTPATPVASPAVAQPASSGPVGVAGTWHLAFDDEFDGTSLDPTKWASSWFGGGTMNNTSTSPSNVSVANGVLTLTLASSTSGALVSTNPNGGATTGFQFTYGYAEARIWLPGSAATVDDWPAFWTDGQSWPANGESDIVEGLGSATSNYHSPSGANNSGTIPGTWVGGWHTYGLDREPGLDTIYWDGNAVRSYTPDDSGAPQYLILNIGGGSAIGATMQVDYVRAWTH